MIPIGIGIVFGSIVGLFIRSAFDRFWLAVPLSAFVGAVGGLAVAVWNYESFPVYETTVSQRPVYRASDDTVRAWTGGGYAVDPTISRGMFATDRFVTVVFHGRNRAVYKFFTQNEHKRMVLMSSDRPSVVREEAREDGVLQQVCRTFVLGRPDWQWAIQLPPRVLCREELIVPSGSVSVDFF